MPKAYRILRALKKHKGKIGAVGLGALQGGIAAMDIQQNRKIMKELDKKRGRKK